MVGETLKVKILNFKIRKILENTLRVITVTLKLACMQRDTSKGLPIDDLNETSELKKTVIRLNRIIKWKHIRFSRKKEFTATLMWFTKSNWKIGKQNFCAIAPVMFQNY